MIGKAVVELRIAVGTAIEDAVVGHQRRHRLGAVHVIVAIICQILGQILTRQHELHRVKRIIKVRPRAPDEFQAHLPNGLGDVEEFFGIDPQIAMQVFGEIDGGAFADADDADVLGADNGDLQVGHAHAQRECRHESGASAA